MNGRVCICGSMTFIDEMEALALTLEEKGYHVDLPMREEDGVSWSSLSPEAARARKATFIDAHLEKIRVADVVLIANYRKHEVDGYVGANSLMEAAFAYALGKPVAVLYPVGDQPCQLELQATSALTLEGDLEVLAGLMGART